MSLSPSPVPRSSKVALVAGGAQLQVDLADMGALEAVFDRLSRSRGQFAKQRRGLANALARKLAAIEPLPRDHPDAVLCSFANPKSAKAIDERLNELLAAPGAIDHTAKYRNGPRLVEMHGQTFLRPTLIVCDDLNHPLANTEYGFPFASVLQVPQAKMIGQIGESLVVSAFTHPFWTALKRSKDPRIARCSMTGV